MNAIILSIGDELVLGQTVDTNSAWLSQQLAAVGCDIFAHATLADDQDAIENGIRECAQMCDFLIVTGGIGPTEDDLTRQALAAVMGTELELNEDWNLRLHQFFHKLGREMPRSNQVQAMIPRGARMIENTVGTAAGVDADLSVAIASIEHVSQENACRVFVMPGVPKEMKAMFKREVLPHIAAKTSGASILSRTLHTFGMGESWVGEKLGELMMRQRNPSVGTTVSQGIVSVRINSRADSAEKAKIAIEQTEAQCREKLGDLIFGADDDTLARVVAASLASSRKSVSTAESCTGGLLAKMLTDIPGSSEFFTQGWITYSNESKIERLGVPQNIIGLYGAVSDPVTQAMARGAQRLAKSDYALAISGVAGPTGGTPAKPVGTVSIAIAKPGPSGTGSGDALARTFTFPGDREMIRDRSAKTALSMLRFALLDKPLPF